MNVDIKTSLLLGAFLNKKYQIFCDMDGVLVDFEGAVVEQINKDLKDASVTGKKIKRLRDDLYRLDRDFITKEDLDKINKEKRLRSARKYMYYRCSNDEDLWANLPWTKDGKELWEEISKYMMLSVKMVSFAGLRIILCPIQKRYLCPMKNICGPPPADSPIY